ncbi:MAG: hypothetical protein E4G98_04200 [Promethearchaeota archaeon]|nr:MAG: hypothetical protein E4G98_04200 [Candidatus Lokiarchaeota archaeon]
MLDTCALNHIRELSENELLDIRSILLQFRIGTTKAIVQEWEHYDLVRFFSPSNCSLLSILDQDIEKMNIRFPFFCDFDEADQSLLWASMQDSSVIISDDGGLNAAALSIGTKAIFLPDFCIFLVKEGLISKNEVRKALKFWEGVHRYRLSEIKRWRNSLNLIT